MRPVLRASAKRPCPIHSSRASLPFAVVQTTKRFRSDNNTTPAGPEAPPFHGYLIDALDAPLHSISPATKTSPAPPPPESPLQTAEEQKLAKARVVFGSRLAGPAERKKEIEKMSTNVGGVMVPPRPEEPDNCCMSGCVNCVWDLYRDEMEEWAGKSKEARVRMAAQGAMDEDGGGSVVNWDVGGVGAGVEEGAGEDLFEGIPVGIREFMRTEKKLKERHARERSAAG